MALSLTKNNFKIIYAMMLIISFIYRSNVLNTLSLMFVEIDNDRSKVDYQQWKRAQIYQNIPLKIYVHKYHIMILWKSSVVLDEE